MDTLRSQFDTITSLTHIDQACRLNQSISDDGESSIFEFKGTAGDRTKFNKDDKKKFAKEISAFANTYGGILCIHKGGDTSIEPFESSEVASLQTPLEGWLRDSLEPPLQGIELKACEGVFLVYIPQSLTKPHRSALDRDYYYRHNTLSQSMSEVMISAMYRSQDYLSTSLSITLGNHNNTNLSLTLELQNESMVAGTKPRIVTQIFSSQIGMFEPAAFITNKHFEFLTESPIIPFVNVPGLYTNGMISTTDKFQERILYPKDHFRLTCFLRPRKPDFTVSPARFFIVRVDFCFLEIPRQIRYSLIRTDRWMPGGSVVGDIIETGSEQDEAKILQKYLDAISADEVSTSPSEVES
ncbi:AlbA family DNA-binding domain-containing protein [Adonisia turfae]|uniref:ATP-binding protein n=1 Tax=Adonisia turfae CCMR0081 TaxID=2292702 RepID=A0A6M0RFP2_9CYAN|nr:ATP-binding protein [Adonisia turfae]NEZ55067.1 ATP-binding protein [Adonisia turfae CCMR0081]